MKPFIKPRPATPAAESTSPPAAKVSPGELTIVGVARALADEGERAAYLDRVCGGDAELRARIEGRLAEKNPALPATVPRAELMPAGMGGAAGGMAIVPMPDMQLTPAGQNRQSSFPWLLAMVLAAAVGALVVVFLNEKAGRAVAESQVKAAEVEKQAADHERTTALAGAMEAKAIASRIEQKRAEAEQLSKEAEARRLAAETEVRKARDEMSTLQKEVASERTLKEQAVAKAEQDRERQLGVQKDLAGSLGKLAAVLVEEGRHREAEPPARQAAELWGQIDPAALETQEARFSLGSALMGKGDTPGAEKELLAAIAGVEPLLASGGEPVRGRYSAMVKKLGQLYSATGRRREAAEVRKKLERLD